MKETKKEKCPFCGCELTAENSVVFDGAVMCRHCLGEQTVICADCGQRIWSEAAYDVNGNTVCEHCYDDYYTCSGCGRLVYRDDVYYDDDDNAYCNNCYENLSDRAIKEYGYKPEPVFYGPGPLYLGTELEIDCGGEYDSNAEKLINIANVHNEHIYCKHDGSIDSGFEIVSHPMTLDYHMNNMNWREVFDKAVSMGYRSHQTSTCGLHCHVSRRGLGTLPEEQEAVIARIVYFTENHWNDLLKFSRRTEASMNRWASRYGITGNTQSTYKNAKDKHMGRYVAVNLENYDTVEFRLFRGTLRYETFIAALQLTDEICRVCIRYSDAELERLSWGDFVMQIQNKPELIDYLKSKRLYVNEISPAEEDM